MRPRKKIRYLTLRLTSADESALRGLARLTGQTHSALVRDLITRAAVGMGVITPVVTLPDLSPSPTREAA